MSSLTRLSGIAAGYSRSMDTIAQRLEDPNIASNLAALIEMQVQMNIASRGYQITARNIQEIHREDNMLSEMLRDA